MRCRPSPRSCSAGRWVCPCSRVVALASCSHWRAASVSASNQRAVDDLRDSLRARMSRAMARRSSSERDRNDACHGAARTMARNCRYSVSSRHNASPCESSQRSARNSRMQGSLSKRTPQWSSRRVPTRKSRLPAMKYTGQRRAAYANTSATQASKLPWLSVAPASNAASSPTQTSNRSPRMKTASALPCSM